MKNQVIKVLSEEHGKKVIEYWKSRGVDTQLSQILAKVKELVYHLI